MVGLLALGFDVHIFCGSNGADWSKFTTIISPEDVEGRMHFSLPTRTLLQILVSGIPKVIQKFFRHPVDFIQYLAHCWRHKHTNPAGFLRSVYLRAHMIGLQLDLMHIEFDWQGSLIADMKFFFNCPLLLSSRGSARRTTVINAYPNMMRSLFEIADYYHIISNYLYNDLKNLGLPAKISVTIIEPSIDVDLFAPNRLTRNSNGVIQIATIARLSWAKGHEFILDALSLVRKAGVQFHYFIFGDGDYHEPIAFAIHQNGLTDSVTFVPYIPREQLADRLNSIDILVHLALEEGFCNAVIEAQAMQIPCVVSDSGGLPENVADGVTGFVVPRRNPRAAAEKIILLAKDSDLRFQMGQEGRKRVMARFDLKLQIAKFANLYNEILRTQETQ